MRVTIILGFILCTMTFISCKKENDAGIQIDGNGRPASAAATNNIITAEKDSTILNGYGIAIDPDGRPGR